MRQAKQVPFKAAEVTPCVYLGDGDSDDPGSSSGDDGCDPGSDTNDPGDNSSQDPYDTN